VNEEENHPPALTADDLKARESARAALVAALAAAGKRKRKAGRHGRFCTSATDFADRLRNVAAAKEAYKQIVDEHYDKQLRDHRARIARRKRQIPRPPIDVPAFEIRELHDAQS
jgi:hypothetical protein